MPRNLFTVAEAPGKLVVVPKIGPESITAVGACSEPRPLTVAMVARAQTDAVIKKCIVSRFLVGCRMAYRERYRGHDLIFIDSGLKCYKDARIVRSHT